MKRVVWRIGGLVSIELREGVQALGQMARSPFLTLFNRPSPDADWAKIDAATLRPLFQAIVSSRALFSRLPCQTVALPGIDGTGAELQRRWINPHLAPGSSYPFRGGKLIELDPEWPETTTAPVLKPNLKLPEDRAVIETTELTNMWGEKDLSDRLLRYFDTGVDRDDLKFEVFPGLWDDRESLRPLTRRLPIPLR